MTEPDFLDEEFLWGHFAAINDHLSELKPIIDQFCARYKFRAIENRAERNPRIRLERAGQPTLWLDLRMEQKQGREVIHQDLPYELSCGAILDDGQGRYYKILQCFSGRPFEQVLSQLKGELENALRLLLTWDAKFLKKNGDRFD
ncbi:hypothetical protein JST97_12000 [bacterium]|nr:hypothetical protein [bacterium]